MGEKIEPPSILEQFVEAVRANHLKANVAQNSENTLHWDRAWIDPGGTIWGPGPYLKVPVSFPDAPPGPEHEIVIRVYPPERLRKKLAKLLAASFAEPWVRALEEIRKEVEGQKGGI